MNHELIKEKETTGNFSAQKTSNFEQMQKLATRGIVFTWSIIQGKRKRHWCCSKAVFLSSSSTYQRVSCYAVSKQEISKLFKDYLKILIKRETGRIF